MQVRQIDKIGLERGDQLVRNRRIVPPGPPVAAADQPWITQQFLSIDTDSQACMRQCLKMLVACVPLWLLRDARLVQGHSHLFTISPWVGLQLCGNAKCEIRKVCLLTPSSLAPPEVAIPSICTPNWFPRRKQLMIDSNRSFNDLALFKLQLALAARGLTKPDPRFRIQDQHP
jgi:hypothetical protein